MPRTWSEEEARAARGAEERREANETSEAAPPARTAPGPTGERASGVVPEPEVEEAPELLGERSDYPAPRADDDEDGGSGA